MSYPAKGAGHAKGERPAPEAPPSRACSLSSAGLAAGAPESGDWSRATSGSTADGVTSLRVALRHHGLPETEEGSTDYSWEAMFASGDEPSWISGEQAISGMPDLARAGLRAPPGLAPPPNQSPMEQAPPRGAPDRAVPDEAGSAERVGAIVVPPSASPCPPPDEQAPRGVLDCMVPDIVRSAERGDESAVLASLRAGHSPDEEDDFGLTALHGAAKKGHLQVVSHLINERADVNKRATRLQGETPVLYACKYGNVEAVRMLLWHQADPSAATADGRTPAQLAQRRGHLEIVRILEGEASM